MSDFTFSATAQCDKCGQHLSSSDEECDHAGRPVETHVFRRIGEGRESMEGVECTVRHKWYALEEKLGEDWIAYQWLGTRESVKTMLRGYWDSVEDLPAQANSCDAPKDVSESED